ncbi:N-6 DNA methylase [Undibacterium sp. FT79W]|uniref:N-6 DNA methylase n=1 Tax=Undibacterium sp. FT79W TaxID=2762296 RepID=UPI00164C3CE6|nr:N-6 DNA methylase [Undibacterium sp. FT79W]MBC3879704.1 N-6 DNA methylase [Undibacterium sp. FT79W]
MTQIAPAIVKRNEGSDSLGRYYTKTDIGGLLIDQMAGLSPNRVLDLGAGAGTLSRAALQRWKNIELLTVDVDTAARTHLRKLFKSTHGVKHSHIHADALSDRLPKLISARANSIDAAVCNPPFIIPKWRKGFAQIVEDAGFSGCLPVLSEVDAALLFLAQNLRLMSANATLGIIVPDSLISASKYRLFRQELLQRYAIRKAIRLPRHSFQGTDAQAYILVISKDSAATQQIPLQKFDVGSDMSSELLVDVDAAIDRLDFDYHAHRGKTRSSKKSHITLGSIALDIKRGSLTSSETRAFNFPVFHTTDMPVDLAGEWCDLRQFGKSQYHASTDRHIVCAEPGDILLARVGRNLEHKVLGVASGYPVLTDCVYRIRVPEKAQQEILKQLISSDGQAWLASRCYGVSAKQLSKADLLTFPVSV